MRGGTDLFLPGDKPQAGHDTGLTERAFLLGSQLALPGLAVTSSAVRNPLLHPAVVDDRNRQDVLSAHAHIADHLIVIYSRRGTVSDWLSL